MAITSQTYLKPVAKLPCKMLVFSKQKCTMEPERGRATASCYMQLLRADTL